MKHIRDTLNVSKKRAFHSGPGPEIIKMYKNLENKSKRTANDCSECIKKNK